MEQRNFLTTTRGIFLSAMVCCFLWGSAFPGVKIGYQLFQIAPEDAPTMFVFAGVRFFISGILGIILGSLLRGKVLVPKRGSWGMVMKVCLFQTVLQYLFYYVGFAHTTGVKGSILVSSGSFFAILIACFGFKQEAFTRRKALGCLLGLSGVVLINLTGSGFDGGFAWNGEGFIFISSTAYAIGFVLMRIYGQREDPVAISGYQYLIGGVAMTVFGLMLGGEIHFYTPACALMLGYLSFVSAAAYALWCLLLKYNPVSKVSIFNMLTPIFGVILSALLLQEAGQISWVRCLSALALVCLGIFTLNCPEKSK